MMRSRNSRSSSMSPKPLNPLLAARKSGVLTLLTNSL